ncbi:MAG: efflux RND transporter periplasmic adaptor subunit [Longimicrobiales bacterium]
MIDRELWGGRRAPPLLVAVLFAIWGCSDDAETPDEALAEAEVAHEEIVQLDSAGIAAAGIILGTVETVQSAQLPVTGTITYDQARVSHVGPRTDGRIMALRTEPGASVAAGQVVAVLESPDVGSIRADLHEAERLVEIARENYEREQRLEAQGISSRRELLAAEAELRREQASLLRAGERLRALGAGNGEGGQFVVTAPFGGVVVEMHATRGEVVGPTDHLFTIADLSRVWIELDVYERDLGRVAVGQPVSVTTTAYGDRVFPGMIVYIGSVVDVQKRTVQARVEVPNPDGALKPGMFARADIAVDATNAAITAVPEGAVQMLEGRTVVFVPGDAPGEFRAVDVTVGEGLPGNRTRIVAGLEPGQRIVVAGGFLLRSELAEGEIGEHGH